MTYDNVTLRNSGNQSNMLIEPYDQNYVMHRSNQSFYLIKEAY